MKTLSVVIIAYNEEQVIRRCLDSVKEIAGEIIVVDSESTDSTATICRDYGCRVFQRKFDGYGSQKQFGVEQATNDWILSVDADEIVSDELKTELRLLLNKEQMPDTASLPDKQGYRIPFSFYYMGKILKHAGVGKEYHLRLFNRKYGRFNSNMVHEGIELNGTTGTLKNTIIHHSYRDLFHQIAKANQYTSQAAEEYVKEGKSFSGLWVAFKFPVNFFIHYILHGGFLDGYPGFMWSFFAAFYGSVKIAKTIEKRYKV
jgi:glycosyltransferase involved in cell wall biosynthesis